MCKHEPEELKACGHCDSDAKVYRRDKPPIELLTHGFSRWRVGCLECGLRTGWYDKEEYAIEAWNRRTPAKDAWLMYCDACDMYDTCRIRITPRMDDSTKYPCPFKTPDAKPTASADEGNQSQLEHDLMMEANNWKVQEDNMKQKKKEARLKIRQEDYDKNYTTEGGYTRPGSVKKSAGGKGRKRR